MIDVVLDTCVLSAALRSRRGASYLLLSLVGRSREFRIHLSVPLALEYEEVGKRQLTENGLTAADVEAVVDYLCAVAVKHEIFFLWRPTLRDADDDQVLELAVEASCSAIITFNKRDFVGAEKFGRRVLSPQEFLREIGELP